MTVFPVDQLVKYGTCNVMSKYNIKDVRFEIRTNYYYRATRTPQF